MAEMALGLFAGSWILGGIIFLLYGIIFLLIHWKISRSKKAVFLCVYDNNPCHLSDKDQSYCSFCEREQKYFCNLKI